MSIVNTGQQPIQTDVTLNNDFHGAGALEDFAYKTLHNRLRWAHENYGDGLVVTSSFGVQSLLLLQAIKEAELDIKVINIDIQDKKYDGQRSL